MNTLRNGTIAVGAPGSTMRRKAEVEDIIRGIVKEEILIVGIVKTFYELYLKCSRQPAPFIRCATRDAGLRDEIATALFCKINAEYEAAAKE